MRNIPIMLLIAALSGPALAEPVDPLVAEAATLAEADAVPAEPLLKKIAEGRAKGVPPARIRPVVRQLHARLVRGRALCGADGDALCVVAAADALALGAGADALARMVGDASLTDRTRALVAFTTLDARGMQPPEAIGAVSRALSEGRLDDLLAAPGADPSALPAPPAVGRGGELPVTNPTRDRDQTGAGKAWGRDQAGGGNGDNPGNGNGNGNGMGNGNGRGNGNGNGNGNGRGNGNNR